jgi:hypothetical protein
MTISTVGKGRSLNRWFNMTVHCIFCFLGYRAFLDFTSNRKRIESLSRGILGCPMFRLECIFITCTSPSWRKRRFAARLSASNNLITHSSCMTRLSTPPQLKPKSQNLTTRPKDGPNLLYNSLYELPASQPVTTSEP